MAALLIMEGRSISDAIVFPLQYFLLREHFSIDIADFFHKFLGVLIIGQGFFDHVFVCEGDINHNGASARHTDGKVITLVSSFLDTMTVGFSASSVSLDKRPPQHIGIENL
jgi:hypothetical protein